jgi:hypothetical protein
VTDGHLERAGHADGLVAARVVVDRELGFLHEGEQRGRVAVRASTRVDSLMRLTSELVLKASASTRAGAVAARHLREQRVGAGDVLVHRVVAERLKERSP